jgi:hypothetical protein
MYQEEKKAYWRFTIRYNFLLLGCLYFLLLGLIISNAMDRFGGVINVWKLLLYLVTLAGSFGSWIYCIRKSWLLTSFDSSLRVATMAYLFGAPVVLLFETGDIVMAVMQMMGKGSFGNFD